MEESSLTKMIKMRRKIWQTDAFFVGGNYRFSTFTLKSSVHRRNTIQLQLGKKINPFHVIYCSDDNSDDLKAPQ